MHVVHDDIDYRGMAGLGEWLVNGLRVDAVRDSSIEFSWRCRNDAGVVAEGGMTFAAIDTDGGLTRVPEEFRRTVVDFQDVPPDPV
jgi:acyl-CoA thioesterase FadM